jgi:hypothetical protein
MDDPTVEQGMNPGDGEQGPEGDVEGHGRLGPTAPKVADDAEEEDVEGHVEPPRDRDLDGP